MQSLKLKCSRWSLESWLMQLKRSTWRVGWCSPWSLKWILSSGWKQPAFIAFFFTPIPLVLNWLKKRWYRFNWKVDVWRELLAHARSFGPRGGAPTLGTWPYLGDLDRYLRGRRFQPEHISYDTGRLGSTEVVLTWGFKSIYSSSINLFANNFCKRLIVNITFQKEWATRS